MCTEVKSMKKNNSKQPNANQYKTPEFASETDVQQVKEQNRQSSQSGQAQNQSKSSEFASETDIQQVKQQNQQAEMKKQKASSSFNQTK